MTLILKDFWSESISNREFARRVDINSRTIDRWRLELPPHAVSYLTLCTILSCSPRDLIDGHIREICETKGLELLEVASICGFNPFTFVREMTTESYPTPTTLLMLDKLYNYCDSFEPAFDITKVKANVIDRVNRIVNAIAA